MDRSSPTPAALPTRHRGAMRLAAAVLMALVLAPALLAAGPACVAWLCPPPSAAGHDCCPPPEASLLAPCCDGDAPAASTAPERTLRPSLAGVLAAAGAPAAALAPPAVAMAHAAEPPASPPGDLLARHCVLRI